MGDVLSKAGEARKMGLSLKQVEYGGELLNQLMACSTKLETIHGKFVSVVSRSGEGENEDKLKKLLKISEDHFQWFEKAKAWLLN